MNAACRLTVLVMMAGSFHLHGIAAEPAPHPGPAPASPRAIAARSLPFLKDKGQAWIDDRGCVSCHQVPSMLWGLHRAAQSGLQVDQKQLEETSKWAVDWKNWNQSGDKDGLQKVAGANTATMAFLLLALPHGLPAAADSSTGSQPWADSFRALLLEHQQKDGSWKAGGQLPLSKRPARESDEVATMWASLALKRISVPGTAKPVTNPTLTSAQKRADEFLATAASGQGIEWYAARLLLRPQDESRQEALLKLQHPDGSWGWLVTEPGDAYGTGLALYALAKSQTTAQSDSAAVEAAQRAIRYLNDTQRPDGSWLVPSTRGRDKNKPIPTSTYWGTTWAVVGMLEWAAASQAAAATVPHD